MKTTKTKTAKMMKTTLLSASVALMMGNVAYASDKNIGDLEIYQVAQGGAATLSLMLDISQSMQTMDLDGKSEQCFVNQRVFANRVTYYLYDEAGNKIVTPFIGNDGKTVDPSKGISALFYGCPPRNDMANGVIKDKYYQRIAKLKKSLLDLLSDGKNLDSRYKMGLGTFPTPEYAYSGSMYVPARPLTPAQRWELMRFVADIMPVGSTPSAMAYAEVGAYMLGNKTSNSTGQRQSVFSTVAQMFPMSHYNGQWGLMSCVGSHQEAGSITDPLDNKSYKYTGCLSPVEVMDFSAMSGNAVGASGTYFLNSDIARLDFGLLPNFSHIIAMDNNVSRKVIDVLVADRTNASQKIQEFLATPKGRAAFSFAFVHRRNFTNVSIQNSGFGYSHPSTKTTDGQKYVSPMDSKRCDGYGIYFLTDGAPNNSNQETLDLVKNALADNTFSPSSPLLSGNEDAGWRYISSFARTLREEKEIKTAIVAFGSSFTPNGGLPTTQVAGNTVVNCDELVAISEGSNRDLSLNNDAVRNLCRWGEKSYGYGEGGFLATSEPAHVTENIRTFATTLNQTLPTSPAGTISIPYDPLSANSIQPYAYLPMVQPEVDKAVATWGGNLKKYHTVNGTLYGKGADGNTVGERLYQAHASPTEGNGNFPFALNPQAQDLWQTEAKANNASVEVGGVFNRLAHPSVANKSNVRSVFVETIKNGTSTLQKVGTDGTRLIDFDKLGSEYSVVDKAYILNFLGYNVPIEESAYSNVTTEDEANSELAKKLSAATFHSKAMLGGVLHSTPTLASYSGQLNSDTGNISSDESLRKDFLLFGSMDGALHMVNARTGDESFAFIPRKMFTEQRQALRVGSEQGTAGVPKFGVDAPWQTYAEYTFGAVDGKTSMRSTKMFAYGGLRMGGVGLYGLNITSSDGGDTITPTLAFSINENTEGFSRLGQTWTKPVTARIKIGSRASDSKNVLFVSGGYDMCYENPRFTLKASGSADTTDCANKSMAKGNAVYMIDAESGALLQTWTAPTSSSSSSGGITTSSDHRVHMKHSIVGEITPLDRNANGFVDSIYFADLGGQIFRIDFQEEAPANGSNLTRRVVRVFDANTNPVANHLAYRFYDKPVVSFYDQPNGRIALVNIATGDRSSPLHKHRALADANRIYGIIDRDLATPIINAGRGLDGLITKDLTNDSLVHHNAKLIEENGAEGAKKSIEALSSGQKQGWYYDMNRYADRIGVKNLKSVGAGAVIGGVYYASIYSPEYNYHEKDGCSAQISGGTERQGYCLPWGICANPKTGTLTTKNGTVGYTKVGPGIQELAIATLTSTAGSSSNIKTLVGTQTFDERIAAQTQGYTGGSGDPLGEAEEAGSKTEKGVNPVERPIAVATNKVLRVKRWYDLQTAEENQ